MRAGLEVLTEKGFAMAGIDEILSRVEVPKGSFYHYFASKEAFGLELIERYASYFAYKLDSHFGSEALAPLARLDAFVADAVSGMERYDFKRGCLIGNLGQEMNGLPESFRARLAKVFKDWETRTMVCLEAAKAQGRLHTLPILQSWPVSFGSDGKVLYCVPSWSAAPSRSISLRNFLLRVCQRPDFFAIYQTIGLIDKECRCSMES